MARSKRGRARSCGAFALHALVALCAVSVVGAAGAAAEPASPPPPPPEEKVESPAAPAATQPGPLTPGDHRRTLTVDGRRRSYLVHVPPGYDGSAPTPVVLAFHGAMMNARMMVTFCGLNAKADEAGFVVVYPNGTGLGESVLFWNADAKPGPRDAGGARRGRPDDVAFTAALLDALATVVNVDAARVYAAGMSNGGMMCHRLAAELADRIAAVAPVTGTLALPRVSPSRPVPVIQIHGTADRIVPFHGFRARTPLAFPFMSVPRTVDAWVKFNGCAAEPVVTELPDAAPDDGMIVTQSVYGPGRDGAEVVLIAVTNGGHTWPGQPPPVQFIGKSTEDVSANDLIWAFFQRHPMKRPAAGAKGGQVGGEDGADGSRKE